MRARQGSGRLAGSELALSLAIQSGPASTPLITGLCGVFVLLRNCVQTPVWLFLRDRPAPLSFFGKRKILSSRGAHRCRLMATPL